MKLNHFLITCPGTTMYNYKPNRNRHNCPPQNAFHRDRYHQQHQPSSQYSYGNRREFYSNKRQVGNFRRNYQTAKESLNLPGNNGPQNQAPFSMSQTGPYANGSQLKVNGANMAVTMTTGVYMQAQIGNGIKPQMNYFTVPPPMLNRCTMPPPLVSEFNGVNGHPSLVNGDNKPATMEHVVLSRLNSRAKEFVPKSRNQGTAIDVQYSAEHKVSFLILLILCV